jgi:sterol desaturase/sphingolipid hydroxylase (fatty acid hydroxylase superfamily)
VAEILGVLGAFFDMRAFLLAGVIFIPLERFWPLHAEQGIFRRWWRSDVVYVIANGVLIRLGLGTAIVTIMTLGGWLVPAGLQAAIAHQPCWLQVVEAVVLADVGFYTAHRMFHRVPWLWRFHAIHHSIETLDWLAAVRVHAFDQVVTKGMSLLPLVALGFDTAAITISSGIYFWHSLLLHANVRMSFGPLRWLLASPDFHHWHHAARPDAYGKNYAGQLSCLDTLFGTMYLPEGPPPDTYGVEDPVPYGYLAQLLHPLKRERPSPEPATPPDASSLVRTNETDRLRQQGADQLMTDLERS